MATNNFKYFNTEIPNENKENVEKYEYIDGEYLQPRPQYSGNSGVTLQHYQECLIPHDMLDEMVTIMYSIKERGLDKPSKQRKEIKKIKYSISPVLYNKIAFVYRPVDIDVYYAFDFNYNLIVKYAISKHGHIYFYFITRSNTIHSDTWEALYSSSDEENIPPTKRFRKFYGRV